ncbi:hypothetical protein E2562_021404 [Oryza meyeriana var. granulata]|uniref:Uncharacterized protein n=1 Tax=Oryza meyeriana var. granulata TaxID=110450 RepID=A0A6G1EXL0_9ORYZ|nr:hypothetical protein E2562_021404 [Oryza meyeriana var. granulata]
MLALETVVGSELALEVKVVNVIVALESKVVTTEDGRGVNVIVVLEANVVIVEDGRSELCAHGPKYKTMLEAWIARQFSVTGHILGQDSFDLENEQGSVCC